MSQQVKDRTLSTEHFVHGLFLLSALFLLALFGLVFAKQPVMIGQPVRHGVAKVSGATLLKNYTTQYPIFNQPQVDAVIRGYIEQKVRTFEQKIVRKKDIRNHLTANYTLSQGTQRVASITFMSQERIVGQPDIITTDHLTFDLQDGRLLTLEDMMQPNSATVFAKLLHDYFKQQASLALTPAELVSLLELLPADIHEFSTESDGLVLHLNPHQPNAATGRIAVWIDKTLLANVLAEVYRQTEPERAVVAKDSTPYRIDTQPPPGNQINPSEKMLALTFDDGPSHLTPQVLDTLDKYEAQATFFVLGKMVPSHAALLQRMISEGNEVGNHSWDHPSLPLLSGAEVAHQIGDTQAAIQAATGGYSPTLMRPPYGATNQAVRQVLTARGLRETLWSVDTNDWRDRDTQVIYDRIMSSAADGRIILLHDIHPTSVEAALRAIRDLKIQGYQLVTVSQLRKYRNG